MNKTNKTILYIAIGVGVLYLIQRRAKKNFKKALEQTADNLGTQLQDIGNKSVTELQKQTANDVIEASKRRGFPIDKVVQKIMTEYFSTIKDEQELKDYQKINSEKMDRLMSLMAKDKADKLKNFALDNARIGISYARFVELQTKFKNWVMPKVMESMKNQKSEEEVSNFFSFDDGL